MTIYIKHQHFKSPKPMLCLSQNLIPQNIIPNQSNQATKTWHLTLPQTNIAHQRWAFCPKRKGLSSDRLHLRNFTRYPKNGPHFFKPESPAFQKKHHFCVYSPQKMGNASFPLVETYGAFFSLLGASLRASQDFDFTLACR